jgi:hypothetical protein
MRTLTIRTLSGPFGRDPTGGLRTGAAAGAATIATVTSFDAHFD